MTLHTQHGLEALFAPGRRDILCGSGYAVFNHPGNIAFRSIVEKRVEDYAEAKSKKQKSRVATCLLSKLQSTDIRILKKDPIRDIWFVMKDRDEILRDKITHHLRVLVKNRRNWSSAVSPAKKMSMIDTRNEGYKQQERCCQRGAKAEDKQQHAIIRLENASWGSTAPLQQHHQNEEMSSHASNGWSDKSFQSEDEAFSKNYFFSVRTIQEMREAPLGLPVLHQALFFLKETPDQLHHVQEQTWVNHYTIARAEEEEELTDAEYFGISV